jgi:hypothetical protein
MVDWRGKSQPGQPVSQAGRTRQAAAQGQAAGSQQEDGLAGGALPGLAGRIAG